jgi:hypothetical protein
MLLSGDELLQAYDFGLRFLLKSQRSVLRLNVLFLHGLCQEKALSEWREACGGWLLE